MAGFSSGKGLTSVLELVPRVNCMSSGTGLGTVLEAFGRSPVFSSHFVHSFFSFNAASAAAAAAATVAFLPSRPSLGKLVDSSEWTGTTVALCDKAADPDAWNPRWSWDPKLYPKTYDIELKPLFSAFRVKALGATSLRALIVNFIPVLEAYIQPEEDDLEEEIDHPPKLPPDPNVALRQSAKHITREVAVITTRRVLERVVVRHVSPRTAWKLLKDVPKSAARKAHRNLSRWQLFLSVKKTGFRAQVLGVVANWIVQLALDVAYFLQSGYERRKEGNKRFLQFESEDFKKLSLRTAGNTLRAVASLIFASIGAGLGTVLIRPKTGTWIGLAAGELTGPFIVQMFFDTWLIHGTLIPPPSPGAPRGGAKGGRGGR